MAADSRQKLIRHSRRLLTIGVKDYIVLQENRQRIFSLRRRKGIKKCRTKIDFGCTAISSFRTCVPKTICSLVTLLSSPAKGTIRGTLWSPHSTTVKKEARSKRLPVLSWLSTCLLFQPMLSSFYDDKYDLTLYFLFNILSAVFRGNCF